MKADYAELFTTYAAAKGITVTAAEQKTATTTAVQQVANIDGAKLQEAIEVKWQLYRNHYSAKNAAILDEYCADEDVLFVSAYAPMAIVSGTAGELKALALNTSVTQMELFENVQVVAPVEVAASTQTRDEIDEAQHWNYNSRANYVRDTLGLTGTGVKIGQVELGLPYLDDSSLSDAAIMMCFANMWIIFLYGMMSTL